MEGAAATTASTAAATGATIGLGTVAVVAGVIILAVAAGFLIRREIIKKREAKAIEEFKEKAKRKAREQQAKEHAR